MYSEVSKVEFKSGKWDVPHNLMKKGWEKRKEGKSKEQLDFSLKVTLIYPLWKEIQFAPSPRVISQKERERERGVSRFGKPAAIPRSFSSSLLETYFQRSHCLTGSCGVKLVLVLWHYFPRTQNFSITFIRMQLSLRINVATNERTNQLGPACLRETSLHYSCSPTDATSASPIATLGIQTPLTHPQKLDLNECGL